jgi:hypothetical protein
MISAIVEKEHPYVLKDDRENPEDKQTVFWIVPKTVRSANQTAADYAAVSSTERRSGTTKVNVARMNAVDDKEWISAVRKIENFLVPDGAPGNAFEHFLALSDGSADIEKINAVTILVKVATEKADLLKIYWAMCTDHTAEIMEAYYNYTTLTGSEKNG